MSRQELVISIRGEMLSPTYLSPFNTEVIFMELENLLSDGAEIKVSINGFHHFIFQTYFDRGIFERNIQNAVIKSVTGNLFKERK